MSKHGFLMECIFLVLLTSVVFASYWPTLENDVCLDDEIVRSGDYPRTFAEIPYLLLEAVPHGPGLMYRPVTFASFTFDYLLWGDWNTGYHLTNLLLAVAAACMAFYLARQLMPWPYALCSALCFAALPGQSEAVIAVFNRSQMLSAIAIWLVLLSLPQALQAANSRSWLWLGGVVTLLGCWAKESTIVMPVLLLLWVYGTGLAVDKNRLRQAMMIQAAACTMYLITRLMALGGLFTWPGLPGAVTSNPFATRYFTSAFCLTTYTRLVVWPFPLSCDYPLDVVSFHAMGLVYPVLIGLLLYWLVKGKPLARLCSMSLLWFVVCLLPVLHLAPIVILLAERFLYPAAWGLVLCVAILLSRLPARRALQCGTLALATAVITASIFISGIRSHDWRDNQALWRSAAQVFPNSYRAAAFFGSQNARAGNIWAARHHKEKAADYYTKAIAYYEKALASQANLSNQLLVRYNLALVWHTIGERRQAELALRDLFALRPDYAPAWMFLGELAMRSGDWQRAILCYRKVPGPRNSWDRQYAEAQRKIAYAEKRLGEKK